MTILKIHFIFIKGKKTRLIKNSKVSNNIVLIYYKQNSINAYGMWVHTKPYYYINRHYCQHLLDRLMTVNSSVLKIL